MGRRTTIAQAVKHTGLKEYTIRKGCAEGRYPHIRTSGPGKGRILIDLDLLEAALEREALSNIRPASATNIIQYGMRRITE